MLRRVCVGAIHIEFEIRLSFCASTAVSKSCPSPDSATFILPTTRRGSLFFADELPLRFVSELVDRVSGRCIIVSLYSVPSWVTWRFSAGGFFGRVNVVLGGRRL